MRPLKALHQMLLTSKTPRRINFLLLVNGKRGENPPLPRNCKRQDESNDVPPGAFPGKAAQIR